MRAGDKVLLVDDEPQVLVALEDLLADEFVVLKAGSAEQARAVVAREPDLAVVVTDQRMPNGTGDELLASLEGRCDASRIMLTGYADLNAIVRAVNAGRLFAYVTKPWDPGELIVKVNNAASHFRLARQLEHEQRLLRDLMDNSPDGIYFKDPRGSFTRTNRAFADILGLANDEALSGRTLHEVLPPERVGTWGSEDETILRTGQPRVDVIREYTVAGQTRWISETLAPIASGDGASLGLVGIVRDVTQRIQDQQELQQAERRFREQSELLNSILDGMRDGVVFADPFGTPVYFNRQALTLLPAQASLVPIQQWARDFKFLRSDNRTGLVPNEDPLRQVVEQRSSNQVELCFQAGTRKEQMLQLSASTISSELGSAVGSVLLFRDVTEQRRLEQKVVQSDKLEAIGRLAGGVAHDFNNLLAVLQGYGDLVLASLGAADPVRDDILEMLRTTERAAALTRRLLEFSRQRTPQPRSVCPNVIIRGMEDMMRRLLGETTPLDIQLEEDLGNVWADAGQLEQIVLNLAINARDAMPGGGTVYLRTFVPKPQQYPPSRLTAPIAISVRDAGNGMDEATRARAFEPFFTTKAPGKGTGLGLATVQSIVEQAGGEIHLESAPDVGTEFTIYLPRAPEAPRTQAPPPPERQQTTRAATVLIVEDDPALRTLLARALRTHGHTVLEADTAARAQALWGSTHERVDLLLTDVVLPGLSGPELARDLMRSNNALRVLFVSGYGGSALEPEPSLGVAYLDKPFTPTALLSAIADLLREPDPAATPE